MDRQSKSEPGSPKSMPQPNATTIGEAPSPTQPMSSLTLRDDSVLPPEDLTGMFNEQQRIVEEHERVTAAQQQRIPPTIMTTSRVETVSISEEGRIL